jgi:hypothetical protein
MEQVYAIASELGTELGDPLGPAQPLGGKPGRDYRVRLTSGEYVVRLPRSDTSLLGAGRESERLANEMAASLGIAPAVAGAGLGWLVTRFLDRRPVDPGRLREDPAPVAAALRSFHGSGLQLPDRLEVPELLERCARTVRECGRQLPEAYALAHALTVRIAEALPTADPVPSHNNLVTSSVLDLAPGDAIGPPRIALVDWEYAAMGDPLFDLASLAVHYDFDAVAQGRLLAAYFGEQPDESRVAALQLMRLMVQARDAAQALAETVAPGPEEGFEPLLRAAEDPRVPEWMRSVAA